MNRRPCEHLGHYERNGTYLRVLLAIPTDHDMNPTIPVIGSTGDDVGIDTTGCVIAGEAGHLIATIGVSDLVIIQAGDATLVARKQDEGRVKEIVDRLKKGGEKFL